jgi:predicted Zn-dependent peptidase
LIQTSRLDNGLTVVTERMPDVRSVTIGYWVGTGSRDEPDGQAGVSHFLEHLLFKGTDDLSAMDIAEAVDEVGGDMNAFTTKEYTAFYVRLLADRLDLGLDILTRIMSAPAFRPDEIEAERQVILEELLMRGDDPDDLANESFFAALYPDHALGREVLGEESTIEAMTREDISGFFDHHYRTGNMVLAAAGLVDHEDLVNALAAAPARPGGHPPEHGPPGPPRRSSVVFPRPSEQAHLVLGVPTFGRHDPDRHALSVMNQILGGGMASRLFQEVREKRGLAYSVYSYRASYDGAGALVCYAGTAPSRAREVLGLMHGILDEMVASGVTQRELEVARGHLLGNMILGLEDSAARMSRIGRSQLVHGEVLDVEEIAARISAVTLDDVARVIERTLAQPRVLSVVGPFDAEDFEA